MNDIAIYAENLSKKYTISRRQAAYQTLRESIENTLAAPYRRLKSSLAGHSAIDAGETIWALKNASFQVNQGEIVGVIGRNGAGKSTLLKILSCITEPTSGNAKVYGRVGSLLEVGTGFHPELTGRENIYLNGAILGMKRTEINANFDEIVAFAEIDKFIDTPVKHYSSGMYMRLAFAVAAHLETDILLVDEVLAVGDIKFQQKCIKKLDDVSSLGQTILVVSHNLRVVEALTSRCIYMKEGRISSIDETKNIISEYQKDALSTSYSSELPTEFDIKINNPVVKISDYVFTEQLNTNELTSFEYNTPINIKCSIESKKVLDNAVVCLRFYKDRIVISGNNSRHTIGKFQLDNNLKYRLQISMDGLMLIPGKYTAVIFVLPDYHSNISESVSEFYVKDFIIHGSAELGGGYFSMKQDWNIELSH